MGAWRVCAATVFPSLTRARRSNSTEEVYCIRRSMSNSIERPDVTFSIPERGVNKNVENG
jgi:hypothetical protein